MHHEIMDLMIRITVLMMLGEDDGTKIGIPMEKERTYSFTLDPMVRFKCHHDFRKIVFKMAERIATSQNRINAKHVINVWIVTPDNATQEQIDLIINLGAEMETAISMAVAAVK